MEKPISAPVDLPQSASPALPRSWPHSQNAKPATRSEVKHESAPRATTILYSSPPHLANEARAKGQSFGDAFASLTAQDVDRANDMRDAMNQGLLNAERQTEYESAVAEDPEALRAMGFHGIDRDDW